MARRAAGVTLAGVVLVVAGAMSGCRAPGDGSSAGTGGALTEEPCVGIPITEARCLRLTVPENQTTRRGRLISLRIVVLPATGTDRAEDALFYLAGGPGQAASELVADSSLAADALRARRDVVFADQRGTGGSNSLICQFYGPPDEPQAYFDTFLPIQKVRACRSRLETTADLAQYTTSASVEDLESIRVALKYPQLTLLGGSYGTRLAMEYVRRYEPRVRAAILESPVTPATHAPEHFGQFAAQALDGLMDECLAAPECARAFPAIREEARQVFERLRRGPVTATVAHPSFPEGSRASPEGSRASPEGSRASAEGSRARRRPAEVTLTRDHVAEAIRYLMYSSLGASRVPLYLHEAFNGNFSPIADFLIRWRAAGTFDGLYLSITCAEDVPLVAPDAAERDDPTYLGGYRVRQQRAACAEWPRGTRSEESGSPVKASVPTLITSGVLDPVTPPENADTIARTLPHSLHLRVPSSGHSPIGLDGLDCLAELKRAFIERGRTDGLDTSCVAAIARPEFATVR
jgi:pimeloyl-ACP methyl ester carboxylesterase